MVSDDPVPSDRETLAASPPFAMLTRELIDELYGRMQSREVEDGTRLIEQGAAADGLLVLLDGEARVEVTDHLGKRHAIAELGPGSVLGEMALLTREPRSADVITSRRGRVLHLSAEDFERLAADHPEVTVVLTEILAERLGGARRDSLGGKRIEDYRVLRCLGRGGMAVVYETLDESRGGERVALKMMKHRLLFHPGAQARFQREADLLMGLEHPNITRVTRCFSAFRTSFLVMEYCDGAGLGDIARASGPLPEDSVRCLLGQLAGALEYLHEKGVVHRDLKPGNVLTTSRGEVKLADFGLARPWAPSTISTSLTTEGAVVGTPLYMPTEQLLGIDVGPEADVYAFGCVALELLLGRPPFSSENISSLIDEKRHFSLPPASEIGGGISEEMHGLLTRCLALDPGKRELDTSLVTPWSAPFPTP